MNHEILTNELDGANKELISKVGLIEEETNKKDKKLSSKDKKIQ